MLCKCCGKNEIHNGLKWIKARCMKNECGIMYLDSLRLIYRKDTGVNISLLSLQKILLKLGYRHRVSYYDGDEHDLWNVKLVKKRGLRYWIVISKIKLNNGTVEVFTYICGNGVVLFEIMGKISKRVKGLIHKANSDSDILQIIKEQKIGLYTGNKWY